MEIPSDVLSKLVCDNCEGYLSRGPVLMLADGKSRCGRCIEPEETTVHRNVPYEELAKLMIFPCRYKADGCDEKLKFEENQRHEEACPFRPFVCPIAESGQCEWFGGRDELLDHCHAQHSDNVVQNAFSLKHNILNSSLHNYLLSAFQVLFLIQTKVCVTSRKIYHSVRLIGDPQQAPKYKFNIEMENNGKRVTTPGDVAPPGCLALQEDTAVAMGINSLLELLGDFRDSVFKINVRCVEHVACGKCKVSTEPVYRDFTGHWLCRGCAPVRRACKNTPAGCTHTDIDVRRSVHERYFCAHTVPSVRYANSTSHRCALECALYTHTPRISPIERAPSSRSPVHPGGNGALLARTLVTYFVCTTWIARMLTCVCVYPVSE